MNCSTLSESLQLEVFPDRLHLRRIDASKNMHRYYLMTVHRDLFGGATLMREWGRNGSAGKVKLSLHADEGQAIDALSNVARRKRKRGYRIEV